MAIVRTRIFSIVDSEFDRAFDSGLSIMAHPTTGTFPFAELNLTTYADQKAYYRNFCEEQISQPNAFCLKTEEDGLLLTLAFGVVSNSVFHVYSWLSAEDANGSKAYVYDKTVATGFHTWLKEQGVTSIASHIAEKSERMKDFTQGIGEVLEIQSEFEVVETNPSADSQPRTRYKDLNLRVLTHSANANIIVDDD
tara:strand:+ start:2039 stop:2623 length:585 start_codon:yes stop_codon:yes gene_type:complete